MKTIQIFDPSLCCSSGVCGSEVDQQLVDFSATARWAQQQGLAVERHNLAQEPMLFAENLVVRDFLMKHGEAGLPLVLADGEQVLCGRYPTRAELAAFAGADADVAVEVPVDTLATLPVIAGGCCGGDGDGDEQSRSGCC